MLSLGELHYLRYSNPSDQDDADVIDSRSTDAHLLPKMPMPTSRLQIDGGELCPENGSYMTEIQESVNTLTHLTAPKTSSSPSSNDQLKRILKIAPKPPQRSMSLNASPYTGKDYSDKLKLKKIDSVM